MFTYRQKTSCLLKGLSTTTEQQQGINSIYLVEARQALESSDFRRASAIFDKLAERLVGISRDICIKFQAYAEAKQGELLRARSLLRDLLKGKFRYSSAYWNLACCILNEKISDKLDVLSDGLEYAPHQSILRGAVYLGLLLEDDRVRQWLPYLTFAEALLISYYFEFNEMTNVERDGALARMDEYSRSGEPFVQTARHAVFIVSELPEGDNLALARALAPSVFAHIMRTENDT